jgi:hypothetical protein
MRSLALLSLLAVLVPALAGAEDDDKIGAAKVYYDAGRQAYEAADYTTAIRSFEEAIAAAPRPFIAFNLALAYRKQFFVDQDAAKLKRAVLLFRQYLADVPQHGRREDAVRFLAELSPQLQQLEAETPIPAAPSQPVATQLMIVSPVKEATGSIDGGPGARVPLVEEVPAGPHRIRVEAAGHHPGERDAVALEGRLVVVDVPLRAMPARLEIKTSSGAEILVDGRRMGTAPLDTPVDLEAGKHHVAVSARGRVPFATTVELHHGKVVSVEARLRVTEQRKSAYITLATAGGLLLGGAIATGVALDAEAGAKGLLDERARRGLMPEQLHEYNVLRDRRDSAATAARLLYGGAGAMALTGALLWLLDAPRAEPPLPAIVPAAAPGELGASYVTRF